MPCVLFYSFCCSFALFLFSCLHTSDASSVQSLSVQPSVTPAISEITARVAQDSSESFLSMSFASMDHIASTIASVSGAFNAAQEASAATAGHQGEADVVIVSANPIKVTNTGDADFTESALVRTDVALAGFTVSSHQDQEPSVAAWLNSVLGNNRMNHCHISDDVKYFIGDFKSSGQPWHFKRFMSTSKDRCRVIHNDAEVKLFQQHHCFQVP